MSFSETLRNKPAWGIALVAVLLIAAAGITLVTRKKPKPTGGRYYYDLSTGGLIVEQQAGAASPLTLSNGHTGVIAHVFACGNCETEKQFIGFIEKIAPAAASKDDAPGPAMIATGRMVASAPETPAAEIKWINLDLPEGDRVVMAVNERCGSNRPNECVPEHQEPVAE